MRAAHIKLTAEQTQHIVNEASCYSWWVKVHTPAKHEHVLYIGESDGIEPVGHVIFWAQGIEMLLTGQHQINTKIFDVEDGGYSDSADRFLQLCVFGEIRYG
jgi:hypothetical protein